MNRNDILYQLSNEIELLARMHIIYGMWDTPQVVAKRAYIFKIASDNEINPNTDIDPTYRILYRRYVS